MSNSESSLARRKHALEFTGLILLISLLAYVLLISIVSDLKKRPVAPAYFAEPRRVPVGTSMRIVEDLFGEPYDHHHEIKNGVEIDTLIYAPWNLEFKGGVLVSKFAWMDD